METFNMSVSCFFFLFCSLVIEDAKSLTLSEEHARLKWAEPFLLRPLPQMMTLRSSMNLRHCCLRSTMRERFDILFVCVTLFIGRIIFDLMANTILVRVVFGRGIFFHFSGSQKMMGALLKILELIFLVIASFIFVQTVK
jgi:hypothetical protein